MIVMEIEIQSKTNNPLLNRTEVRFLVHHEGEGTPKRDLIRSELAEKLKVKKENVVVNYMKSSFGDRKTWGYAKAYTSMDKAKAGEQDHILVRNAIITPKKEVKKEEKPVVEKPAETEAPSEPVEQPETPSEQPSEEPKAEEQPAKEEPEGKSEEEKQSEEKQTDEKKEEP